MSGERWNKNLAELRARIAKAGKIRVAPKGLMVHSGPPLDKDGFKKLLGPKCRDCGGRIVVGSGELRGGRCGSCATAWDARDDDICA